MNLSTNFIRILNIFILIVFPFSTVPAASLPQDDDNLHLGVATCSGSTCHGANEAFKNSSVLQNEYITWQREDKHSKAYEVLLNDDSKRIARNLNIKSAHTAKICLDCHADNVPESSRGKRFHLSDGIGCEACHGGAQRYLGLHVSGVATHQDNIASGLFPTEDPQQRARLCLSCHLGTKDKFVTHKILGAGHPRLSFELDTYTAIAPAHYQVDADYKERKTVWSGAKTWSAGQAIAVKQYLNLISNKERLSNGLFPELSFFDCFSCHQTMDQKRWRKRASSPLGPGRVRIHDANLLMLMQISKTIAPKLTKPLKAHLSALHEAGTQSTSAIISSAKKLQNVNNQLLAKINATPFTTKNTKQILNNIIEDGLAGEYIDYAEAEQSLMAIDALLSSLSASGAINLAATSPESKQLNDLYKLLDVEKDFNPYKYRGGLENLKKLIN